MVGNDVVDLREAAGTRHPRFDGRVFAPSEAKQLAGRVFAPSEAQQLDERVFARSEARRLEEGGELLRWVFWAAKEAAYKRVRRADPRAVFSPGRFVVDLGPDGCGRVRHGDAEFALRVSATDQRVHAVAADTPEALDRSIARVGELEDPADPDAPGREARRLALHDLAIRLGVDEDALRIERRGRVPWLRAASGRGQAPLSLSHHGRFVAYACHAPEEWLS